MSLIPALFLHLIINFWISIIIFSTTETKIFKLGQHNVLANTLWKFTHQLIYTSFLMASIMFSFMTDLVVTLIVISTMENTIAKMKMKCV